MKIPSGFTLAVIRDGVIVESFPVAGMDLTKDLAARDLCDDIDQAVHNATARDGA